MATLWTGSSTRARSWHRRHDRNVDAHHADKLNQNGGSTMNPYVPIFILAALGAGFAIFSVAIAPVTGPKRFNRAKYEPYECGIEPTPQPTGGGKFPIKYYLTAMLFIIFDIESIFLIPWAVRFDVLGLYGYIEMILFMLTIFVAYAYVWRRGGLEWD
jgi:NADH-quinone oxidoreductase subunit A